MIGTEFKKVDRRLNPYLVQVTQDLPILVIGNDYSDDVFMFLLSFVCSFFYLPNTCFLIEFLCSCYMAATMQVVFSTHSFCTRSVGP